MHPMFVGFRTRDGKKKTVGTNQSAIEMTERPSAVKTEKSFLVKLSFMHSWCSGNISDRQSLVSGSNPDGCSKNYPRCGVLVAFFTVTEADRVRIPACGLKYAVLV